MYWYKFKVSNDYRYGGVHAALQNNRIFFMGGLFIKKSADEMLLHWSKNTENC